MFGVHNFIITAHVRSLIDADGGDGDRGASMVEYALLLVLVLLASFFTIAVFGDSLVGVFDATNDAMNTSPTGGSGAGAATGANG